MEKKIKKSIPPKKSCKAEKRKNVEKLRVRTDSDLKGFHGVIVGASLTFIERLKLVRNCILILIAIAAIVVFLKSSIAAYEEIDLIIIFSSIIFALIALLLLIFFVKCIQDIKNGTVKIYKGVAKKGSDDILYSSYLPMCMIVLDRKVHHVGINHYLLIKDNDFVSLRRTPVTKCIVGLKVTRKGK
jgi:hypothetical protein